MKVPTGFTKSGSEMGLAGGIGGNVRDLCCPLEVVVSSSRGGGAGVTLSEAEAQERRSAGCLTGTGLQEAEWSGGKGVFYLFFFSFQTEPNYNADPTLSSYELQFSLL